MKYYKLMYDYEKGERYIDCNDADLQEIDRYIVSGGILINEWKQIIFEYDGSKEIMTDYVFNAYRWPIVSKKFCSLVSGLVPSDKIQNLPVTLFDVSEKCKDESYSVLNVLDVIDAIDLEHSDYDVLKLGDKKINFVKKYALKKKAIEGHDIFRLKNDTIPLFISERVKNAIEENQLLGFDYLEVKVV